MAFSVADWQSNFLLIVLCRQRDVEISVNRLRVNLNAKRCRFAIRKLLKVTSAFGFSESCQ